MNEKLRSGDDFDIAATTWNEIIDAKDFVLKFKAVIQALAKLKLPAAPIPTDIITVKNITAVDRLAGEVLEIGDVLFDRVMRNEIGFEADTVSHTGGRSYCILARPVPCGESGDEANGKLGPAHISGVCVALVNIIATTDRYAYVKPSETKLTSGKAGQFKILGPVDSTGEQTVAVSFSDDGRKERLGKADADIALGDMGTVSFWEWDGSAYVDTTLNDEALALVAAVPGGDDALWCSLLWGDGVWVAFPQCPE